MANSLNLKNVNNVTSIAQKDSASTLIYELQDENNLTIFTLDNYTATIKLVKNKTVEYQTSSRIADGRIELSFGGEVSPGVYTVEVYVSVEGFTYVFPSDMKTKLEIHEVTG